MAATIAREITPTANNEVKGHYLAPLIIIMLIMMLVSVGARWYSRVRMLKSVGWDDWLIVPATIVSVLINIACLICTRYNWGHHVSAIVINHHDFILTRFIGWVIQPGFTFACGITKCSILLFYTRFAASKRFIRCIYIMLVLITLWTITFVVISFTICKPLSAYWIYTYKEKAVNHMCSDAEGIFYLVHGVTNLLFDCIVFALPIPTIWRLRIPKNQKYALTVMMLGGSLVCFAAFYRLVVLFQASSGDNDDLNWYGYDLWLLICTEIDLGIFCASIGAAKPLILKLFPWLSRSDQQTQDNTERSGGSDNYMKMGDTTFTTMSESGKTAESNLNSPQTKQELKHINPDEVV